ncbi:MAG: FG-GAP repeat domain-containing protein [Thermoanaerobaculia bacterium]
MAFSGALFLVAAAIVSAPGRAEDIPFVRTVIALDSPRCPCGKALGDLDGDGRLDAIVAGSDGPLVWYAYPDWTPFVIAVQGTTTQGGLAVGDLDRDGDLDVTVGTDWFENPRLPAGNPAAVLWPAHRIGSGRGNQDVAIGDLDRDGKPDVVLRGETGSVVTLFKAERIAVLAPARPGSRGAGAGAGRPRQGRVSRHCRGRTMAEESAWQDPLPVMAAAQLRLLEPGGGPRRRRSEPGWPA